MNPASNITSGHVRAFQAVTSQMYDNITLWSCRINGEEGVAIVMVDNAGEGKIAVMPLFVALTDSMEIDLGDGAYRPRGSGSKDPSKAFAENKAEVTPRGVQ